MQNALGYLCNWSGKQLLGGVELDGDGVNLGKSDNCFEAISGWELLWDDGELADNGREMKEKKEEMSSWLLLELEVVVDLARDWLCLRRADVL